MKKLFTIVALSLATTLTVNAQKMATTEDKCGMEPTSFKVADVDNYLQGAYKLGQLLDKLSADLDQLEKDIADAGPAPGADKVAEFNSRATELENAYKSAGEEAERVAKLAEAASKGCANCGIKAPKCTKQVGVATRCMSKFSNMIKADASRAAKIKLKVEALNATN
ncbi:MAG: hypothetical protein Kow0079_17270 [Vicingaceae bacterium]